MIYINLLLYSKNTAKFVLFLAIQLALLLLLSFINQRYKVNISKESLQNDWELLFCVTGILAFLPSIRKEYINQLTTSGSAKVILIPIIICSVLGYVIELSRYVPILLGGHHVSVASGQAIDNTGMFTIGSFVFTSFLPGFCEEFVFRFIPYNGLRMLLNKTQSILKSVSVFRNSVGNISSSIRKHLDSFYYKFYMQNNRLMLSVWVIVISTLFSLAHIPDKTNFYMYFINGIVYSYLFLRYGLLASIVGHATHNYFSSFNYWFAGITVNFLTKIFT